MVTAHGPLREAGETGETGKEIIYALLLGRHERQR